MRVFYPTQHAYKKIAAEIFECHKQNNNKKEAAEFQRNLERDAIDCFLRGLKLELEKVERTMREEINLTPRNELRRENRQHSLFL